MSWRSLTRTAHPVLALVLAAGCEGGITRPEQPDDPDAPKALIITSVSATRVFALPGESVERLPVVSLAGEDGLPAAGIRVTFSREGPDGNRESQTTLTDDQGIARLPSWQLGRESGQYRMVASADHANDVVFTAYARGSVTATYDLKSSYGVALGPGDPVGHFVLYADGSFSRYYDPVSSPLPTTGWYERPHGGMIVFYLDPSRASSFYQLRGHRFSIGWIDGDEMSVAYEDLWNFDPEIYRKRD